MDQIILDRKTGMQIKTYRKLMGMKQVDAAKLLNVCQANYCHMEAGRQSFKGRQIKIVVEFNKWRTKEIERLTSHIEYLESL